MRRGTTTCSMSCWQVWTTGTNRSSTCKEPRPITTWTKYITHQWTQTTLTSVFFLIIFSLALFLLYMSHLVFLSRVVSVNWRGSKTSKTSSFWFSALRPSVCMLIRSPPSGPSSPLSCSLATCASAHMRCVCVKERERVRIRLIRLWYHTSLGFFASEWVVWGGSYLQRSRGQEGWLFAADSLRGTADRHHSQSHSQ